MSQVSGAFAPAGAAGSRGAATTPSGSVGARFVKLLLAVFFAPLLVALLMGLYDLHFLTLVWRHAAGSGVGSPGTFGWRLVAHSLAGLVGLTGLGLSLGLLWSALAGPERWLTAYVERLLNVPGRPGGAGAPVAAAKGGNANGGAAAGGGAIRWVLFEVPFWALGGLLVQGVLRALGQSVLADAVLAGVPFAYGVFGAGLLSEMAIHGERCRRDGFLFTWLSSATMQLSFTVLGLVFFLQARPVLHFLLDWLQATVVRAVQWGKWLAR